MQKARVQNLIDANKFINKIKNFVYMSLTIQKISLEKGKFLVATNTSWGNTEDLKNQADYIIYLVDENNGKGNKGVIKPMRWKFFKEKRHI